MKPAAKVIPLHRVDTAQRGQRRQHWRGLTQAAFFALFTLAPVFDIFRLDLERKHFILLGMNWTLGLDAFVAGRIGAGEAALNLVLRGFLPIVFIVGGVLWLSWKYGRLYCGWLCPHFSVVELINGLMRRASGKPSLWEKSPLPTASGAAAQPDRRWWLLTLLAVLAFAFLWALVALTYLLPPAEIYGNLWQGALTRNQALFLGVGSGLLCIEFLLARHLFCRYACAAGLFMSLAWMANRSALVVGFQRRRAADCASCFSACDHACPMRLKPRNVKRLMFACVQCGQCLSACDTTQQHNPHGPLLSWVRQVQAESEASFNSRSALGGEPPLQPGQDHARKPCRH